MRTDKKCMVMTRITKGGRKGWRVREKERETDGCECDKAAVRRGREREKGNFPHGLLLLD